MSSLRARTLALVTAIPLAGCSLIPTYVRPPVDVPTRFAEASSADGAWIVGTPSDAMPRGDWWAVYRDPVLDDLEGRVSVSNQDLKRAAAQLQQARALVDVNRADAYPQIGFGATPSRARVSDNVVGRSLAGKTTNDFALGIQASWEPDLFGRIAARVESAKAEADAIASDLESLRLAMTSDLAIDYFSLRSVEADKAVLDRSIEDYARARDLIHDQFVAGYVSEFEVSLAQTQLDSAKAQSTDLDAQAAQLRHAIATLVGVAAGELTIQDAPSAVEVPPLPIGLPSQLLQRRPDIAAAERRVAAMNDQIGEAKAAHYPNVSISLVGGLESAGMGALLSAPSRFWSLGSTLGLPLFDGGRRDANLANAQAGYDAAVASYRGTVIGAINQVEDQVAALRVYENETTSQRGAVDSSERGVSLAEDRFNAGGISFLDVVNTRIISLQNQRALVALQRRQVVASVLLIKALGGTWDTSSIADAAQSAHRTDVNEGRSDRGA